MDFGVCFTCVEHMLIWPIKLYFLAIVLFILFNGKGCSRDIINVIQGMIMSRSGYIVDTPLFLFLPAFLPYLKWKRYGAISSYYKMRKKRFHSIARCPGQFLISARCKCLDLTLVQDVPDRVNSFFYVGEDISPLSEIGIPGLLY